MHSKKVFVCCTNKLTGVTLSELMGVPYLVVGEYCDPFI